VFLDVLVRAAAEGLARWVGERISSPEPWFDVVIE